MAMAFYLNKAEVSQKYVLSSLKTCNAINGIEGAALFLFMLASSLLTLTCAVYLSLFTVKVY